MLTRCTLVFLVVAAAVVALSAPLGAAEDPAGVWIGTTTVPDRGTNQLTLTIEKGKDGYTGTMVDSLEMVSKDPLQDVRFVDGTVTFSFQLSDGALMSMRLKVAGDAMTGEWVHPGGDTGPIELHRKKG